MRNLIDRMSAENISKLQSVEKTYPYSTASALKELQTNKYWIELSYQTIGFLVSHLGLKNYQPDSISDVFEPF